MSGDEKFVFHGQTTFINNPTDTVIRDFQNTYLRGDGSTADDINAKLQQLIELTMRSKDLPDPDKEEVVGAVHAVAEQVRDEKTNKITLRGTLDAVKAIVERAADIAGPAIGVITAVLKIAGVA